jgi:hypothetical protein
MRLLFQDIILNQIVVAIALLIVLGFISTWALMKHQQYPGYGLGWLMSLFFLLIYTIVIDDRSRIGSNNDLNLFHIFIASVIGLTFGATVQFTRNIGANNKRNIAIRVAFYTTLNLILLGLVFLEGRITQNMIGIFGIAFGIALLIGMIWDLIDDDEPENPRKQETPPQNIAPRPRFDNARPRMKGHDPKQQ